MSFILTIDHITEIAFSGAINWEESMSKIWLPNGEHLISINTSPVAPIVKEAKCHFTREKTYGVIRNKITHHTGFWGWIYHDQRA